MYISGLTSRTLHSRSRSHLIFGRAKLQMHIPHTGFERLISLARALRCSCVRAGSPAARAHRTALRLHVRGPAAASERRGYTQLDTQIDCRAHAPKAHPLPANLTGFASVIWTKTALAHR